MAACIGVLLILWAAAPVFAMRCGTELIDDDSTKFEVLQACGEPMKKYNADQGGNTSHDHDASGGYELWIYDIGGGVYHIVYFSGFEVYKIEMKRK